MIKLEVNKKEDIKIRKLPKSSYIWFILITIMGVVGFSLAQSGNNIKATKILTQLGYENISNVKAYSKKKVEDSVTKIRGIKYFVTFDYNKKKCRGFIYKDFKGNVKEDLTCK